MSLLLSSNCDEHIKHFIFLLSSRLLANKERMASNFNLNREGDDIQRTFKVLIEYQNKYKAPALFENEDFYTVYSPKKIKLTPREDIIINLHFNVTTSKELDPWISLLPTLKCNGLCISSKTVNSKNEIELHLKNDSYYYTVDIKKHSPLAFIFILGKQPLDLIKTEYHCIY